MALLVVSAVILTFLEDAARRATRCAAGFFFVLLRSGKGVKRRRDISLAAATT